MYDFKLNGEGRTIGRWGRLHLKFIKENRPVLYSELVVSGKLWNYLADLNDQAQNRLDIIVMQMKEAEGVTEEFKRKYPINWVQAMNSIRNRAEEIVLSELIYI